MSEQNKGREFQVHGRFTMSILEDGRHVLAEIEGLTTMPPKDEAL